MADYEKRRKYEEGIRKGVAEFLSRNSNRKSLITVTGVGITADLREVRVFVSVYPDSYQDEAIKFLNRNKMEIQNHVKSFLKMGRLPKIGFAIDEKERKRQEGIYKKL